MKVIRLQRILKVVVLPRSAAAEEEGGEMEGANAAVVVHAIIECAYEC